MRRTGPRTLPVVKVLSLLLALADSPALAELTDEQIQQLLEEGARAASVEEAGAFVFVDNEISPKYWTGIRRKGESFAPYCFLVQNPEHCIRNIGYTARIRGEPQDIADVRSRCDDHGVRVAVVHRKLARSLITDGRGDSRTPGILIVDLYVTANGGQKYEPNSREGFDRFGLGNATALFADDAFSGDRMVVIVARLDGGGDVRAVVPKKVLQRIRR